MKNSLLSKILIILIIIGIFAISIIIPKAIFMKKVNSQKEITSEQFKQTLSNKGYYVSTSLNEQSPNYLKNAYTAISKNQDYDIKFYETENEDEAIQKVFLREKEVIEKEKNKKAEKDINIKQYNYYEANINNQKYIIIRNRKTVISTKIEQNKEKEVKSILKGINYIL